MQESVDMNNGNGEVSITSAKKRYPKACNACRQSKVKCDERKPTCGRCKSLHKTCVYIEKPKSAEQHRIEELENEVTALRQLLQLQSHAQSSSSQLQPTAIIQGNPDVTSPHSVISATHSSPSISSSRPTKRRKAVFQMQKDVIIPDFVAEGVLTETQAVHYFNCFFDGCDRYVPIFDRSDSFVSMRLRSSLLLNAVCAVGCSVSGETSTDSRMLHVRLKRRLTSVILSPHIHSLETVQALLVMACWMPERSLILAVATRIAIDLQLEDAFDRLVNLSNSSPHAEECHILMKSARTWNLLWNLQQILQVDGGNLVGLQVKGVRRCRMLLDKPFSSKLDARLFSQVELNSLRIKINEEFANESDDLLQSVCDACIDISIWFDDWKRIIETSPLSGAELQSLRTNLMVQRYWADAMAACKAIRITGVNNIDAMSYDQKEMLSLAKVALQKHLHVILTCPHYLANFRYAMDFVWAKCAFSFLLLLKLTILLPDERNKDLPRDGRLLHDELSKYSGYGSSRAYLRLLQASVEKYAAGEVAQSEDLDSFIPEEFIFEWDFPGLNLFSSPGAWELLFDQYLLGDEFFEGIGG